VRQRRGEVDICFSTFNSLNSGGRKEERKSLSIEMKNRAQMKARFWDGGGSPCYRKRGAARGGEIYMISKTRSESCCFGGALCDSPARDTVGAIDVLRPLASSTRNLLEPHMYSIHTRAIP